MNSDWDSFDDGGANSKDDLKAYLEERKKRAARYIRTAQKAQEHLESIQKIDAARKKALGGSGGGEGENK